MSNLNTIETSRHSVESEAKLAELWSRAHRLRESLETRDGQRFRVVHPGVLNTGAGPDFRGAVLEDADGRQIVGDVELHLAARDWYSHGHHADANYNGVVLHVVIKDSSGRDTIQQSGTISPVAEFPVAQAANSENAPGLKFSGASNMKIEEIAEMLDALGDQRFIARSTGFSLEFSEGGNPDQILYVSLMEALGYKSNQKAFQRLANLVPYSTFYRYRDDPYETRVAVIEALIVSASGLMSGIEAGPRKTELERLARKARKSKKLDADEWKLFRVRPNNHPTHRMAGFARVLAKSIVVGLAAVFKTAALQQEASSVFGILDERPFIGAERSHEMVVSVVLPYLHNLGVMARDGRLAVLCIDEYRSLKALPSYESTVRFARSIEIPTDPKFIKTARRQQGLLHLQKHFAEYAHKFDVQRDV